MNLGVNDILWIIWKGRHVSNVLWKELSFGQDALLSIFSVTIIRWPKDEVWKASAILLSKLCHIRRAIGSHYACGGANGNYRCNFWRTKKFEIISQEASTLALDRSIKGWWFIHSFFKIRDLLRNHVCHLQLQSHYFNTFHRKLHLQVTFQFLFIIDHDIELLLSCLDVLVQLHRHPAFMALIY